MPIAMPARVRAHVHTKGYRPAGTARAAGPALESVGLGHGLTGMAGLRLQDRLVAPPHLPEVLQLGLDAHDSVKMAPGGIARDAGGRTGYRVRSVPNGPMTEDDCYSAASIEQVEKSRSAAGGAFCRPIVAVGAS